MKHVRTVSKSRTPAPGQTIPDISPEVLVILINFVQDVLSAFLNLFIAKQGLLQ